MRGIDPPRHDRNGQSCQLPRPLGARADRARLIGLLGPPGEVWPSLALYDAAFQALGLHWRCVPLAVSRGRLRQALLGLPALGFAGAALADAYVDEAATCVHELSPAAQALGAVKVIRVTPDGRLAGDHLGWLGFLETLRMGTPALAGLRPLIIGAGRRAESVVYALTREGLPLTILDGHLDRAIDLVHRLRHVLDRHSFSLHRWPQDLERLAPSANLIVNAVDFGLWPEVDRSPWIDGLPFPPQALVIDLVPWPDGGRFLRQAAASGARTVGGLSVLAFEAALAIEMWTGHPRPVELMQGLLREALAEIAGPSLLRAVT